MSIESWRSPRLKGKSSSNHNVIIFSFSLYPSVFNIEIVIVVCFFLYSIVILKWKIFKWRLFTIVDCDRNAVKRAGIFIRETNWIIKENRIFKLHPDHQSNSSDNQILPKIGLFYRQQTTMFPPLPPPLFSLSLEKKIKEIQKSTINRKKKVVWSS